MKSAVLLMCVLPSSVIHGQTAVDDSLLLVLKKRSSEGLSILDKYYPEGSDIVRKTQNSKRSFTIGGSEYTVDSDDPFIYQFSREGVFGMLDGMSTGVHEEIHLFDVLHAYETLEQRKNLNKKDIALYISIYLGNSSSVLLKMPSEILPCQYISWAIPVEFRSTERFTKYIYPSSPEDGTQVIGIYALIDEWNAYYHQLETAMALKEYVKKDLEQTDLNWIRYFMNYYQELNAYLEFKIYILTYFMVCHENAKSVYKALTSDPALKEALRKIQINYNALLSEFSKTKEEIIIYLNDNGLPYEETEDFMKIGTKQMTMLTKRYKAYEDFLSSPEYMKLQKQFGMTE